MSAQSEADTVHLTGSFGSGQQALAMDGDMQTGDPDDLAMDVQLEVPQLGSGVRMILLDQTVYMNLGQPTGNKYAEIDLSDPSDPLGQQFGPLLDTADPGRSIAALDEGMQTLDKVGGEELDGVATTQYRAVVDTEKALAASGVSENMPPEAAAQLPKTLTYDVWVGDDDGLIRKMSFDLLGQSSELTFSDWGEDVEIEAPPASEITKGGAGLGCPSSGAKSGSAVRRAPRSAPLERRAPRPPPNVPAVRALWRAPGRIVRGPRFGCGVVAPVGWLRRRPPVVAASRRDRRPTRWATCAGVNETRGPDQDVEPRAHLRPGLVALPGVVGGGRRRANRAVSRGRGVPWRAPTRQQPSPSSASSSRSRAARC